MATALQLSGFNAAQIALIKRTVAKDCNDDEFNLFMEAAKRYGLDPFRKQISALVFNKNKSDKRQMAIIVARDGLRTIAQRCGDYRPASEPAEIVYDEALKSAINPKGIVSATVRLWKQDKRGEWFAVIGEAYWDEFAAVKDEWGENRETGKWEPTGARTLEGNWLRMPVVMIVKCAEAQALRAGWPDAFGGIYAEEEFHAAEVAMTASEAVAAEAERARMERLGGRDAIMMTFDAAGTLERVPLGKVADRCAEHLRSVSDEEAVAWNIRNRDPLREFWARSPSDALEVKKQIEAKEKRFKAALSTASLPGVEAGARTFAGNKP